MNERNPGVHPLFRQLLADFAPTVPAWTEEELAEIERERSLEWRDDARDRRLSGDDE